MRALDAALRDVLNSAPHDALPQPQDFPGHDTMQDERPVVAVATHAAPAADDEPLPLDETMDVVTRAANAIDELVQRNRSITDAAVRSVEFFRKQAGDAVAEAEMLREELRIVREQAEAQSAAAQAQTQELETELASRTAELALAQTWIDEIRSQVDTLLGDAQTRLASTTAGDVFGG